ncbi:uncharacterized protein LOC135833276 [Planococcus citri]|uniref:uncharacterized protein LOC135833276 n=1 Tax=Planococcus citri TaxID=170843 RepID=UPI0031F9803C
MLKVKYCCRSCTAIFVVILSVFHMQSCQVITTENTGSLDIDNITKTDNETLDTGIITKTDNETLDIDSITKTDNETLDIDSVTKTDNETTPSCKTGKFQCRNCVLRKLLCDGKADCYDGKDKADCWCNAFWEILTKDQISNAGDTFNMTCLVYGAGEPIPEIEWNQNEELVPRNCTSTGDHGTGVMTCPSIESAVGHYAGVYSSVAKRMYSCSLSWVCLFH